MRESHFATNRRDIYDPPLATLSHAWQNAQSGVHGAPKIDAHDFVEVFDGHVLHRTDKDRSRVVDQHIYMTKLILDGREHGLHLSAIRDVALGGEEMVSARGEFVAHKAEVLFVVCANRYTRANRGKFPGHYKPQPARAAGDQYHLAIQIPVSRLLQNRLCQSTANY